ncbi:pirin family protein [Telluria aromaticivorans]|uniref:Pirin family protein n=1 Tax=Telluria aromaticivorans TaxID=2725995 RepID=A0A7Y2K2H6_9BURK|nr:pirin family protein [Telluria aromaticivorans]NNG25471.1 pirin family protein [Telluria aromaticivorans]
MTISTFFKSHEKDLGGGLKVRRVLPAAAKQAVGPFIFFDHFGPLDAPADANHDVRPHPHIGLATVSYLYEGAMEHRDSVGSVQRVEPGAINWMTSGSGIVHSERVPADLAGQPRRSHGLQLWAALPKSHEEVAPSFAHTPASAIPSVRFDGGHARVLIGSAFGLTSPVVTFSETLYLDIRLDAGGDLVLADLPEEAAIYAVGGAIDIDGAPLAAHTMAYLEPGTGARISTEGGAQFVVIGGEPLDGPRFIFWNFVSSSKERLARAADDWEQQRFDKVPGETEFIPLPKPPR